MSTRSAVKRTAGHWDSTDRPLYFIAANLRQLSFAKPLHGNILIALNELSDDTSAAIAEVEDLLLDGRRVLVDSGVFWLAGAHARAHDMPLDIAIGLPPEKLDGFDKLYARYVALLEAVGKRCWGYVEIDLGGRVNKRKTRSKLERHGLRPIPVYHPLNDGWDYFDELAKVYDRICLGNIAKADPATRKRLIATIWARRAKYPGLWVHALGLTPSELIVAYPVDSYDSSTWMDPVRWGHVPSRVAVFGLDRMDPALIYRRGDEETSERSIVKGTRLCGAEAAMTNRIIRNILSGYAEELGADIV